MEANVHRLLDADGDGKFTVRDLQIYYQKTVSVLSYNIPSTAAFSGAFLLGLRYG